MFKKYTILALWLALVVGQVQSASQDKSFAKEVKVIQKNSDFEIGNAIGKIVGAGSVLSYTFAPSARVKTTCLITGVALTMVFNDLANNQEGPLKYAHTTGYLSGSITGAAAVSAGLYGGRLGIRVSEFVGKDAGKGVAKLAAKLVKPGTNIYGLDQAVEVVTGFVGGFTGAVGASHIMHGLNERLKLEDKVNGGAYGLIKGIASFSKEELK